MFSILLQDLEWSTFLQDSMNSSMVTTPSLFRSIFWNENTTTFWLTASLFSQKQYWCHQYFSAFKQSLNEGERKHCYVWPGRSSPHVLLGHRPAWWGMCISPSCHRWTSWCPASPVKCMEKQRKQYWEFPIKMIFFFSLCDGKCHG